MECFSKDLWIVGLLICSIGLTTSVRPVGREANTTAAYESALLQQELEPGEDGTYSQNYQDTWAMALANYNKWPKDGRGFFLDLGAYHGTWCSNSALLERKLGWQGICVEPQPVGFEDRKCVLAARALSDVADETVRFYGHDQVKHIGRRAWEDSLSDNGNAVKTLTIGELLNCANGTGDATSDCHGIQGQVPVPNFIHFVSLDIEGLESKILQTFPWDKVEVGAWVVEQTDDASRPANAREDSRKILKEHGYIQAPVENPGVDEYYVLPKFWHESLAKKEWRVHPPGSHGC